MLGSQRTNGCYVMLILLIVLILLLSFFLLRYIPHPHIPQQHSTDGKFSLAFVPVGARLFYK